MKTVYKILILVGAIFALVGAMLTFIFLVNRDVFALLGQFFENRRFGLHVYNSFISSFGDF